MKYFVTALFGLLVTAGVSSALAEDTSPRICPTQLSTAAVDLGHYHGVYMVTRPDGTKLAPGIWMNCSAQTPGPQHAWESCNFSLCNLPDGLWQVRFSPLPASAYLTFSIKKGIVNADTSDFLEQVGNYGIDATGFHRVVKFMLHGYAQNWNVDPWPGPDFRGTDTNSRGLAQDDVVGLSLYPHTPYAFRFGAKLDGVLQISKTGQPVSVSPGGALRIQGGVVHLRVAPVHITPDAGPWQLEGATNVGAQDVILPAGATFRLHGPAGQVAELTLDEDCKPSVAGSGFTVALAPGAKPEVTCP